MMYFPKASATFVHIPKTAGTSFKRWAIDNNIICDHIVGHGTVDDIKQDGISFTFVRNPFDRLVSLFHFEGQRCEERCNLIASNPHLKEHPDYNKFLKQIETDKKQVEIYKQGFETWLMSDNEYLIGYSKKINQAHWFSKKEIDIIIKVEELESKFHKIQEMLGCYEPLPYINTSKHKNYKEYYTSKTIERARKICQEDLERFKYNF